MDGIPAVEACPVRCASDLSESRFQRAPQPAQRAAVAGGRVSGLRAPERHAPLLEVDANHRPDLQGLYHWNLFDAAVLLPYFAVMIVLSIYGVHRYTMCYLYFKYRKNYRPDPPRHFEELPQVTIQLPIFI